MVSASIRSGRRLSKVEVDAAFKEYDKNKVECVLDVRNNVKCLQSLLLSYLPLLLLFTINMATPRKSRRWLTSPLVLGGYFAKLSFFKEKEKPAGDMQQAYSKLTSSFMKVLYSGQQVELQRVLHNDEQETRLLGPQLQAGLLPVGGGEEVPSPLKICVDPTRFIRAAELIYLLYTIIPILNTFICVYICILVRTYIYNISTENIYIVENVMIINIRHIVF